MKKLLSAALLISLFSFAFKAGAQVNYALVCVDSVWYDSTSTFINVRIFNGDTLHINYPTVQIVSPPPANDTISNRYNLIYFFAQLGNTYQVYTDTITQPGITDFSSYTFLMHDGLADTTAVITWCNPLAVKEFSENELKIFPVPAIDKVYVTSHTLSYIEGLEIYDVLGNIVCTRQLNADVKKPATIDVSGLKSGIYFIRVTNGSKFSVLKFVKQ